MEPEGRADHIEHDIHSPVRFHTDREEHVPDHLEELGRKRPTDLHGRGGRRTGLRRNGACQAIGQHVLVRFRRMGSGTLDSRIGRLLHGHLLFLAHEVHRQVHRRRGPVRRRRDPRLRRICEAPRGVREGRLHRERLGNRADRPHRQRRVPDARLRRHLQRHHDDHRAHGHLEELGRKRPFHVHRRLWIHAILQRVRAFKAFGFRIHLFILRMEPFHRPDYGRCDLHGDVQCHPCDREDLHDHLEELGRKRPFHVHRERRRNPDL